MSFARKFLSTLARRTMSTSTSKDIKTPFTIGKQNPNHCVKISLIFITQILREINLWDSRSAKSAILTHLMALNCNSYEFMQFQRLKITKLIIFITPKMAKTAV